ncbi:3329_t:CDS:2 [Dentiscutata erythropus]|uniref:3329_t:CDS:1 n=1 Tax=Dentiscutata erythropus TaxID=1348616 RepID=A0A9N9BSL0_9GLOM|nr:3329_t:CDS:2 [Dentiscutata erythropus]
MTLLYRALWYDRINDSWVGIAPKDHTISAYHITDVSPDVFKLGRLMTSDYVMAPCFNGSL